MNTVFIHCVGTMMDSGVLVFIMGLGCIEFGVLA